MTLQSIPVSLKFLISLIWDFLDLTIGRIPGFGTFFDIAGGLLAMMLWGTVGILAFAEVIDITDQIDAQLPIVTVCGILTLARSNIL